MVKSLAPDEIHAIKLDPCLQAWSPTPPAAVSHVAWGHHHLDVMVMVFPLGAPQHPGSWHPQELQRPGGKPRATLWQATPCL